MILNEIENVVLGMRYRFATIDGRRAAYVDEGEGRTVLLLHGAPMTSLSFVRVVRELRRTHRVIAPDLPGFGLSEPPDRRLSLHDYADFVHRFATTLDLRDCFVLLNDASGPLGLAACARMPERLAGLIIADTVALPMTGLLQGVAFALRNIVASAPVRWLNARIGLFPWLVATVAPMFRPFSRAERKTMIAQFDSAAARDRIIDLFESMGRESAFIDDTMRAVQAVLIHLPVLLLYGQFDPMRIAGSIKRFQRVFRNSTVKIVAAEEHFPILGHGKDVAEIVRAWIAA